MKYEQIKYIRIISISNVKKKLPDKNQNNNKGTVLQIFQPLEDKDFLQKLLKCTIKFSSNIIIINFEQIRKLPIKL